MKRELPDWLEKRLDIYIGGSEDFDSEINKEERRAFRRCYQLMSEQQKHRPIESAPRDKRILLGMDNGKFWATGEWWEDHNSWSYPFNVEGGEATHWLPLPTPEGE